MSNHTRNRKDSKTMIVRIVSMVLAVLMVLSVILASVWRW